MVSLLVAALFATELSGAHALDPRLARALSAGEAEMIVVLKDQADLGPAAAIADKGKKGRFVFDALHAAARRSQPPLLAWLAARGLPYRPLAIVNAVWVKADAAAALALAARPDVLRVEANPRVRGIPPEPREPLLRTLAVEPGVSQVNASAIWGAVGNRGEGIVVADADTGVFFTHDALKTHYRGWNGGGAPVHDRNWHDALHPPANGGSCGTDSPFPCDPGGHGTHTTGLMVGDDGAGNQIGAAPGAQWIGCRNMEPDGTGTPARYLECMEFFLAPYPIGGTTADGDPSLAPDVVNNSWGCPVSEGCSATTLESALAAQEAAGILNVAAAGNSGTDGCGSVVDPPATSSHVLTVGALQTGTTTIAGFSSLGPVTVDGSNRMKPDLVAPGMGIRSSEPPTPSTYLSGNGTSYASPLTAGVAALLLAAQPALRHQPTQARGVLTASAAPILASVCASGPYPNDMYGWGLVDASAALSLATTAGPLRLVPVTPCRLVDTRGPVGPYGGPLAPNTTRVLAAAGRCGIASGARAVVLNVTAVNPDGSGVLRLFPAGIPTPPTDTVHMKPGVTRASIGLTALDAAGSFAVRCDMDPGAVRGTDLVVDVSGYFQ